MVKVVLSSTVNQFIFAWEKYLQYLRERKKPYINQPVLVLKISSHKSEHHWLNVKVSSQKESRVYGIYQNL